MTDSLSPIKTRPQSLQAWVMALRPKTLLVGITPIAVGTLITPVPLLQINWQLAFCLLVVVLSIQSACNMINDALDFKNKLDTNERIGPTRVTQAGLLPAWQVLLGALLFLILALTVSIPLIIAGGIGYMYLTMAGALFSYLYSGGPYPLSTTGVSEPFVLIFFGFAATCSAYFLQTGTISTECWIAATQLGLLASVLLAVNNLRDVNQDAKVNKRTLAVRFGIAFGKWEIATLLLTPYLLNFYYWFAQNHIPPCILPMFSILLAINLIRGIWRHEPSRLYNRFLAESAILPMVFGILLALGFRAI